MTSGPRIGFVGLGQMGAPMARMIAGAGWPLTVFARRKEALDALGSLRVSVAPSLRALGEASDVVGICVVDDSQLEAVLLGGELLAGMRSGGIVAVHSTVHPETCRRLARAAADRGIALIDAPVSGGPAVVLEKRLSVMVGGEPRTFEACRPLFESYAGLVRLMGPVGSGQLAKAVNNLVFIANLGFVADAVGLGERLGLDPSSLAEVMKAGSGSSFALGLYAPGLSLAPFTPVAGLLRKDLNILIDIARGAGLEVSSLAAAAEHTVQMLERPEASPGK